MFKDEKTDGETLLLASPDVICRANLEGAADIMEQRGHCQGRFEDEGGRICTANAVALACGCHPHMVFYSPEGQALTKFLRCGDICAWNNEPGRTKQEVVDALRGAARA